jgi:flagellar hook-associated protein 2
MAVNSLNLISPNRITGIQSGLDTDTLIKNLMKAQQAKYDKMFASKTKDEWKRSAYVDLNNSLRKFTDAYASFSNAKSNMTSVSAFKSYAVDLPSNPSLSAAASSSAREGSFTVTIDQLARGAAVTGSAASINLSGFSSSVVANTKIGDISSFASGQTVSGEIKFSVNGEAFTFQSSDTLKKVMDKVNASSAGVTMSYSQLTNAFTFETKATGAYQGLSEPAAPPPFSYVYDGSLPEPPFRAEPEPGASQQELDEYAAYQQELSAYQTDYAARESAARAAYQTLTKQYEQNLNAYKADQARTLSLTDGTGFLAAIGVDASQSVTHGQSALLTVNGVALERDANEFEIDGVSFKLTGVTASPVSFTVKQDVQKSVDMIKSLVDAYNTLIEDLYGKLAEKKNYTYAPLTDEQRAELSETEAELWDAKAKAGLLGRDPTLRTLVDSLQRAFSDAVGGLGTLSGVGLSSGDYFSGNSRKIQIDETKLSQALSADPDKVYQLFNQRVEDAAGRIDTSQTGLIARLTSAMDKFVRYTTGVSEDNKPVETGIKALDKTISNWNEKMTAENTRLYNLQESYYKKFAAMESALAKLQSQSDALSNFGL